ncbi:MAG: acylphosphatase [Bacteroidetes bacterium]|nr:MAG: acylphosphatase [Bacteroidota bacterium]
MKRYQIWIRGKVQGVWFRASAKREAEALGLVGFVKNLPDGRVYAEAEGDEAALNAFVDWCMQGPPLAKVWSVEVSEVPVHGFSEFEIRR